MRRLVWLGLLAAMMPLAAAAQETRGNISGTVRDAQGVVPGASVTVTNVDTNISQRLVTYQSGYYEAPLLNPGPCTVTTNSDMIQEMRVESANFDASVGHGLGGACNSVQGATATRAFTARMALWNLQVTESKGSG